MIYSFYIANEKLILAVSMTLLLLPSGVLYAVSSLGIIEQQLIEPLIFSSFTLSLISMTILIASTMRNNDKDHENEDNKVAEKFAEPMRRIQNFTQILLTSLILSLLFDGVVNCGIGWNLLYSLEFGTRLGIESAISGIIGGAIGYGIYKQSNKTEIANAILMPTIGIVTTTLPEILTENLLLSSAAQLIFRVISGVIITQITIVSVLGIKSLIVNNIGVNDNAY